MGRSDGDGDGQGIVAVVLAALAKGHDELGGHQPHGVAAGGDEAAPVMRRAAGFHGHDAGACHRLRPALEGGAPQDLAVVDRTVGIEHADGEDVLGQIDADGSTLVHDFPSWFRIDDDESQSWHFDTVRLHGRFRTGKSFVFVRKPTLPPVNPIALPALDVNGRPVAVGDHVLIREIPHWLTHNLPDEDIGHLRAQAGTVQPIRRFDEYGYAWFGDDPVGWFCLRPEDVELSSESALGPIAARARRGDA